MPRRSPAIVFTAVLAATAVACASAATKRARSLYDRGDYAGAVALADAELKSSPGDAALWRVRLRASLAQGDARGATDAYLRWRQDAGDDHEALRDLAVDTLAAGVTSRSAAIQVQAIQAVEELEIEDLSMRVAEQMGDDDDVVAAAAAVAILRGYPQAPQVATEMLSSEDPAARAIAVTGIGKKVGKYAVDDLRAAAADGDPRVRRAAVVALSELDDGATLALLKTLAVRDPAGDVRASALLGLAKGHPRGLAALAAQRVSDPFLGARLAAVELLARAGDRAAVDRLLDGQDVAVAVRAARSARDWNAAGAMRAIDRGLADGDWTVRAAALNMVVATLGKGYALPRARKALRDPSIEVQLAGARVLVTAGAAAEAAAVFRRIIDAPVVAVMAPLVVPPPPEPAPEQTPSPSPPPPPSPSPPPSPPPGPDDFQRLQAAIDLARLDDAHGRDALAHFATTGSPELRRAAVGGHGTVRRITRGLVSALGDDAPAVRVEAARVLWRLARD